MSNSSTSNFHNSVDDNTLISDVVENKIEPFDDDDMNDNENNLQSPVSSSDLIDFSTGPLNPNCVTTVTNANNVNDDTSSNCKKNYQEIGSIKSSAQQQQQQQQRQQKLHRKQQQYHQRNLQKDQKQQHYLSRPPTSFIHQQMYKTSSDVGGLPFSSYNNINSMPSYSSQSNYINSQSYHQQHNYQSNQNYPNMMNPVNPLQPDQQQQYENLPSHRYYQEPIFRPPPTSAYYQNYFTPPPRQIYDYASIYGHPPQSFGPSSNSMYWYSQQHHQNNFTSPHFPQGPPHHPVPHSHQLRHIQHSQYLPPNATGNIGPTFGNNQHNEQMMSVLQFSNSNGREARNRAEKQRRDKLNGSIADLATMVPHVAESPRRVDKTAVLRYSAHGLRLRYVFGKTLESKCDDESGNGLLLTDSITKLLDGFLLTVTCRGQIVLITPSVEQHLGHCQTDLFGQNILHITHPDDHQMLKQHLIPTDLDQLFDIQEDENGEPRSRTQEEENEIDRRLLADKRNFTVRLARATPRSEPAAYEIVKIDGCFRRADSAPRGVKASTFPSGLQLIRRARGRDDSIPLPSISANDIVLVAMVRIIKPPKIIDRLREANNFEYKTRHLIDGRMIMVDQRISLVAGYMTEEVTGLSPFTFMHQDDVRWVIVALRQMYDSNSSYGESCYRLLTRTGRFIYLRSRGYLEIDKNTNQVHSFVCINSLVSEEEGRQRCQEMKNKFSIIINAKIPSSNTDGLAVDNPQQLEKAVIYLIENLQKTAREVVEADDDEYCNERGHSNENTLDCNASIHGCDGNESPKNTERLTKSPPLTLVPPNTSSIKSSISKSVTIVNTTAAKSFRISRARSKCLSEKSSIKDDISCVGDDSNSSYNSNLNVFGNEKEEDQNDKTSFQFNKTNHNCGNKLHNNNENISNLNSNSCNRTNKNKDESESNHENQQKRLQNTSDIDNISIKTENIEYFSDNENINDNNNRVPPLPKGSGYYEIEIISEASDTFGDAGNIIMTSRTEYKRGQPSSTSLSKLDELNRNREQQKHLDLKRVRTSYEDITLDSCDGPSRKRMALSDSPLGIENISTSSLDNDQIFVNASTTMQRVSNPQEDLSQLLPSSFSQIKNSLSHIKTATTELKRQCIAYADTQNQLEEIIDERDKQEELLENIQNEYEAHLLEHQGLATSPITSDGSVSIPLSNILTSSEVKSSATATKTTTVIDFDTDDILQRNINLANTR